MLVLQILIVPFVLLILLSVVFINAATGSVPPPHNNRSDRSISTADKFSSPRQTLPPLRSEHGQKSPAEFTSYNYTADSPDI